MFRRLIKYIADDFLCVKEKKRDLHLEDEHCTKQYLLHSQSLHIEIIFFSSFFWLVLEIGI